MNSTQTWKKLNQVDFFDFAAKVGLTKHIGGIEATERLIELCHIGKDNHVLDVGCGVGTTPCYIARIYGCRVVGVDILPKMIERSRERQRRVPGGGCAGRMIPSM